MSDEDRPRFIQEQGAVIWQGREYDLTPQQAAILKILCRFRGAWVPQVRIAGALWPAELPMMPESAISVQIRHIRAKLEGVPLRIEGRRFYGYRLVGDVIVE